MMTGQIFFSPDKPQFWPVKLMNIIIIFLPMENRITLAVQHCRSGFCRQVGEKFIHTLLSSFPRLSPVLCPFIYTFSINVRRCRKSPRFILYLHIGKKLDPFRCPARDRNSPPQRRISSLNICSKEVDLARNLSHKQRIRHQKSTNIQQSFRLGRRATLYRERLIKKEDFKRRDSRDRRRLFSISLVFIRQFWIESANKIMFDIKKFYN